MQTVKNGAAGGETVAAKQKTMRSAGRKEQVAEIALAGVFTAIVFVFTMLIQVQIIPAKGGMVHLGNVPLFFAAAFFGRKVGAVCGGLGMALCDLVTGWTIYAPLTLVVVGLMGFVFGWIVKKKPTVWNLLAATAAVLVIKIVGYYIYEIFLTGSFYTPALSVPGNVIQIVTGAIIALPLILATRIVMNQIQGGKSHV